jgi:hypothetical protein
MVDITSGGITVTISGSPTTGAYRVNDHYVVGSCTVTGWTPEPTGSGATRRHGGMVNTDRLDVQGYDGRMDDQSFEQAYDAGVDVSLSLPLALSPGQCLTISASGNLAQTDLDAVGGNAQMLAEGLILHCVAEAPASPSISFRPPYAGTIRHTFTTADIVGTLPTFAAPFDPIGTGVFDFQMDADDWLIRPQNHMRMAAERPSNRMPWRTQQEFYPAVRSKYVTALAALAISDHARKIEARDRLIQDGIDIWGCLKATMVDGRNGLFTAGAGYGNGFYFPLLFAGYMLDDEEMLSYLSLKWANHGGQWRYDTDFDETHPCEDGEGNPIDYTGESVGCFWETTSCYLSPTAWDGYELPRPREDYTAGFPLYGDARPAAGVGGNDSRKDVNKVYNAIAYQSTGYGSGLGSGAGWGDYMHSSMTAFAGNFIIARLIGIDNYYPLAAREMAYWWLSDNKLWPQACIGNTALEDVYAYGGTGNGFVRGLKDAHFTMGAYDLNPSPELPVIISTSIDIVVSG